MGSGRLAVGRPAFAKRFGEVNGSGQEQTATLNGHREARSGQPVNSLLLRPLP